MIGTILELGPEHMTQELLTLYHQLGGTSDTLDIEADACKKWLKDLQERGDEAYVYILQKERRGDATSFDCFIGALGTLLIDEKLIHGKCRAARIEDVVVHEDFRGLGLGKSMVSYLVRRAKEHGCYKISLSCQESLTGFYEWSGFVTSGVHMDLRF